MQIMIAICFGLVGAFYMLGGYVVFRAMAMDVLIDKAIEGITLSGGSDEASRKDRLKAQFLGTMAFVSFAGGAFLFFQSAIAPILFVSSLLLQALYTTVLAPRYFDTEDDDDEVSASGRRATINAMLIYLVVTVILLLAQYDEVLPPVPPVWSQRETAGLFVTVAFAIYALWLMQSANLSSPSENNPLTRDDKLHGEAAATGTELRADSINLAELRIQAVEQEEGLWARYEQDESWHLVDPDVVGLSLALESKISDWEDRYDNFFDSSHPGDSPQWSDADKKAHFDEALEIARLVKHEMAANLVDEIRVTWVTQDGEVLAV